VSVNLLLAAVCRWILAQFKPASVAGDVVNCPFRSIALALYSRESLHIQLRLLFAAEVHLHREKVWDDCCAWSKHHGTKSWHLQDSLVEVWLMRDRLYGTWRGKEGKRTMQHLDLQPANVLCVHRIYTQLACDNNYQHWITYMKKLWLYYCGIFGPFCKI